MPAGSSPKRERQYKHIKESAKQQGRSEERAEEIAARTVNKERREEDRTPNTRSQGTGNPRHGLEQRSKTELENRARELHIRGHSQMTKGELVEAIRRHE